MDATTNLALRAILRGLHESGAIGDEAVGGIAAALHEAEAAQRGVRHGCVAYDLMQLAAEIERDCGLKPAPAAAEEQGSAASGVA
jgi:hypothetical protein